MATVNNPAHPAPIQEFDPTGKHRLISPAGYYATEWANYTQWTYLDGWVGHTAYFGAVENVCTPQEFMELTAVQKAK